jgi:hypothetical protein
MGYLTYRTGGPLRSPNPTMNTNIAHMFRSPASSLRIAGGLGLLSMAGISAPTLSASPLLAEVSVNIVLDPAPPPPRHEIVVERDRPGPDYLWIDGYWDGSPGRYVWVAGRWDRPPHPHGAWVAPHWDRDHDGHYHMTKGEWR